MMLEILTNPKPLTKRDGTKQAFRFEKLERALTSAFTATGETDPAVIREIVEAVLTEFGPEYIASESPTSEQLRNAIFVVLEKRNLPVMKERFAKKISDTPAPAASSVSIASSTPSVSSSLAEAPRMAPPMPMAGESYSARRRRLNEERKAVTHKFQVAEYEGYLTVGLYDDGQPGEIFLRMNKEGSILSSMMDAFATAVSISLQYGVPLKVLVKKFAGVNFKPNGPTQNPNIPNATSIMDYIFRWLALKFLTPEERQEVLGLNFSETNKEYLEISNVDGARQSRLLESENA